MVFLVLKLFLDNKIIWNYLEFWEPVVCQKASHILPEKRHILLYKHHILPEKRHILEPVKCDAFPAKCDTYPIKSYTFLVKYVMPSSGKPLALRILKNLKLS